jgi:hypothetical protein
MTAIAFGANDQLAVGDFSGHLRFFDRGEGDSLEDSVTASGSVTALAYSQDGSLLAAGGADGVVKIWDTKKVVPIASLAGDQGRVLAVSFHPTGSTGPAKSIVAIATEANKVSTWDVNSPGRKALRMLPVGSSSVAGMAFGPGDVLYVGLQTTPPPRLATLHILALLGGSQQTGKSAGMPLKKPGGDRLDGSIRRGCQSRTDSMPAGSSKSSKRLPGTLARRIRSSSTMPDRARSLRVTPLLP